ncbi:MAG: DUF2059 domain-containing protein [Roseovarius sp.]
MTRIRPHRPLVFLAALAIALLAALQVRAADRARLEAFLEVTGFGVALDSIALAASDAPAMLGVQASDFGSDWSRISDDVFDTGQMKEMALDILSETLSDEHLTHAAEFYATSLGQRLVEAENASHMVADDEAKQSEGRALVAEGVENGDARIETLQALNEAVDADGNAVRAVQEVQVRFLMAASYAGILDRELDEGALRAAMKEGEAEMRMSMKAGALAGAAYTYQDFSQADLQTYLEALQHPDMQTVYQLMNAVQYEIMANRFEVLAARMAEMHPGQEL